MASALSGLPFALAYIDDILIMSGNWSDHWDDLDAVLTRLAEYNIKIAPDKSHIGQQQVQFLGFIVGGGNIHPVPAKVSAMMSIPEPTKVADLRSALAFFNWYRRFIRNFSSVAATLNAKLKKGVRWKWNEDDSRAFQELKDRLKAQIFLYVPDRNKDFYMDTDASDSAIGAVLYQIDNLGNQLPIEFYSRSLSDSERAWGNKPLPSSSPRYLVDQQNWGITDREFLAGVESFRHWRHYLLDNKTHWNTDHSAIVHILTKVGRVDQRAKHARWAMYLSEYDISIKHVPGKDLIVADAVSRLGGQYSESAPSGTIKLGAMRGHPDAVDFINTDPDSPIFNMFEPDTVDMGTSNPVDRDLNKDPNLPASTTLACNIVGCKRPATHSTRCAQHTEAPQLFEEDYVHNVVFWNEFSPFCRQLGCNAVRTKSSTRCEAHDQTQHNTSKRNSTSYGSSPRRVRADSVLVVEEVLPASDAATRGKGEGTDPGLLPSTVLGRKFVDQ